jgi:hypothetical protein
LLLHLIPRGERRSAVIRIQSVEAANLTDGKGTNMPLVCGYAISAGMWEMWASATYRIWALPWAINARLIAS